MRNVKFSPSQLPNKNNEFCFKKIDEPSLINQYRILRKRCYASELNINLPLVNRGLNKNTVTVGCVSKDFLVGGAKITFHKAGSKTKIPLEQSGINLSLIDSNILNKAYCEFSKLAVDKLYRNRQVLTGLVHKMYSLAKENGCEYIFAIAPECQARDYSIIFNFLGLDYKISSYEVPYLAEYKEQNNKKIKLCISNVKKTRLSSKISA